jgi:hypothetical protein
MDAEIGRISPFRSESYSHHRGEERTNAEFIAIRGHSVTFAG